MSLYDDLQVVASDLLSNPDFKQGTITLLTLTPGVGPIDEPGDPSEQEYTFSGGAVRGASFKFIQKGLAVATDKQATVPVDPGVPLGTEKDFLIVDGLRYKIVNRVNKPEAGTPVAIIYIIRR